MRIGLITGEYPPMQGGVGDYTRELARAMVGLGHEVFVLTSTKAQQTQGEAGIHVQATVDGWGRWGKHNGPRGEAQAVRWVKDNRLDVVNIQYQAAAYQMHAAANDLPRTLRPLVPVFTTFHDLMVPYLFPKAGPLRKRAVYQMARHSSGVIVTNIADERELQAVGEMPPVVQIPIGSNIAVAPPQGYSREAWRERMRLPAHIFLVGYFGFINATKGVDTLAHAVRLFAEKEPAIELVVIGGGAGDSDQTNVQQLDEAERLIGGLGINRRVHWTGFVAPSEVSAYLMACDVVALPFKDGVSFRRGTLMAALAHGCPIVTTLPTQPIPELVDGGALRMVEANNPQQLCDVLWELARDSAQRQRLGQAAAYLSQQFRWETIASEVSAFMAGFAASPESG
ncbi:MAG: glycosyltransferase family 4 protein [Anaerolineales bacterium]|nr:glycosyltransferase family 4 protein [Anaerolineales bacterium]